MKYDSRIVAIANASVFDGERLLPSSSVVVIEKGRVAALLQSVPTGAQRIDGTGATLLPGLIDSHVHTAVEGLRVTLQFGVTTVVEMGAQRTIRERQEISANDELSDLRSAGIPLTGKCGHPNQLMLKPGESLSTKCNEKTQLFPTPSTPQEAINFVAERIEEGSDFIKLLLEEGTVTGHPGLPTPSQAILAAAIGEAHRQAKIVVAHALTMKAAAELIQLGVDGLSHIFLDRSHTPEVVAAISRSGAFVIPCLVLNRSFTGSTARDLAADPRVSSRLSADWIQTLQSSYNTFPKGDFEHSLHTVRALKQSGVLMLAGTDAAMPQPTMGGLAQGASLHHELQLLVEAGLTPVEALNAATAAPARIFGLIDRGRIVPGARADLLLVDGDPTTNISDTLSIREVWRRGARLDVSSRGDYQS